jgi:alcohol dehydrogenase class IV
VLLPHVIRFNLPAAPDRYADVAVALGVEQTGSAKETAGKGVEALIRLSKDCGVPQRLSELGIPHDAIPSMAKAAMQVTRLLKNNLRPMNENEAAQIYEASY